MMNGYRVYEREGHVYVDMSHELTPLEEAFYNTAQEINKLYDEVIKFICDIGGDENDKR